MSLRIILIRKTKNATYLFPQGGDFLKRGDIR
jgi:hypothetical protein